MEDVKVADATPEETEETEERAPTVEEIRALVEKTAAAVRDAEHELSEAREAYQDACKLQVSMNVQPTLAELNAIQKRTTNTETRRKNRAMKALGELGFGDRARPKPHPPLFKLEK